MLNPPLIDADPVLPTRQVRHTSKVAANGADGLEQRDARRGRRRESCAPRDSVRTGNDA